MAPPEDTADKTPADALHAELRSMNARFQAIETVMHNTQTCIRDGSIPPVIVAKPLKAIEAFFENHREFLDSVLEHCQKAAENGTVAEDRRKQLQEQDQELQVLRTRNKSLEASALQVREQEQELQVLRTRNKSLEASERSANDKPKDYERQLQDVRPGNKSLMMLNSPTTVQLQEYEWQLRDLKTRNKSLEESLQSANTELERERDAGKTTNSHLANALEIVKLTTQQLDGTLHTHRKQKEVLRPVNKERGSGRYIPTDANSPLERASEQSASRARRLRDETQGPHDQIVDLDHRPSTSTPIRQDLGEELDGDVPDLTGALLERATKGGWAQHCLIHANGRFNSLLQMANGFITASGPDAVELLQEMDTLLKDLKALDKDISPGSAPEKEIHSLIERLTTEIGTLSVYIASSKPLARTQISNHGRRSTAERPSDSRQHASNPELSLSSDVERISATSSRKRSTSRAAGGLERPRKLARHAPGASTALQTHTAEDPAIFDGDDDLPADPHNQTLMSGALQVEADLQRNNTERDQVDLTADSSGDEVIRRSQNPRPNDEEEHQAEDDRPDLDRLMDMIVFGWDASDAEKAQLRKQFQPFVEKGNKSLEDLIKALDLHAFGPPSKVNGGPYPRGCLWSYFAHVAGAAALGATTTQRSCSFCKDKESYICGWLKHLPGVATGYGARGLDGKVPKAFAQYDATANPRTVPFNGRWVRWVFKKRKDTKHDAQETFLSFKGENV